VWLTGVPTLALFIVSIIASHQQGGAIGTVATAALGLGLAHYAIRHICVRSRMTARQLLKATIIYLPLELVILALGKG
jgi:hypothetical protein